MASEGDLSAALKGAAIGAATAYAGEIAGGLGGIQGAVAQAGVSCAGAAMSGGNCGQAALRSVLIGNGQVSDSIVVNTLVNALYDKAMGKDPTYGVVSAAFGYLVSEYSGPMESGDRQESNAVRRVRGDNNEAFTVDDYPHGLRLSKHDAEVGEGVFRRFTSAHPGVLSVDGHGFRTATRWDPAIGEYRKVSASNLAWAIRNHHGYRQSMPVQLLNCQIAEGYARALANELVAPVIYSPGTVEYSSSGSTYHAMNRATYTVRIQSYTMPSITLPTEGGWKTVEPNRMRGER